MLINVYSEEFKEHLDRSMDSLDKTCDSEVSLDTRNTSITTSTHFSVMNRSVTEALQDSGDESNYSCWFFRRPKRTSSKKGKGVIRPIAFKPVTPGGIGSSYPSRSGGCVNGSSPPRGEQCGASAGSQNGRDSRYTSTPSLTKGHVHHYGSMGDLKSINGNSSCSLDRRGLGIPVSSRTYYDPYSAENLGSNKHSSLIKLNADSIISNKCANGGDSGIHSQTNSANTSSSSAGSYTSPVGSKFGSPPSYLAPPPRPTSRQSGLSSGHSTIQDDHNTSQMSHQTHYNSVSSHLRYPSFESRLGSVSSYDNANNGTGPSHYRNVMVNYDQNLMSPSSNTSYDQTSQPSHTIVRPIPTVGTSSNQSISNHSKYQYHHPLNRMGGSVSNLTRLQSTSVSGGLDRSASVAGSNPGLDRSGLNGIERVGLDRSSERSNPACNSGSLSELRLNNDSTHHHQTPSPSDSGVAELEAMMKDKDSSGGSHSLEHNGGFKSTGVNKSIENERLYDEKEKTWERELEKIRELYDARLKSAQQKALKVEHSLTTQTYQLQQDRRKLTNDLDETKRERDSSSKQIDQMKKELTSLRAQLEETEWGLCQKSGEISLLKTQLKDSQGDQTTRGHELLHLREQLRQYQQEVEKKRTEVTSLHDLTSQLRKENNDLCIQLSQKSKSTQRKEDLEVSKHLEAERREMEIHRDRFEDERKRWLEEKERVISYQKQLHTQYISIFTRNRQLEEEVARLTGVPLPPLTKGNPPPASLPSMSSIGINGSLKSNYAGLRDVKPQPKTESRC